jgi:hypothetical protein
MNIKLDEINLPYPTKLLVSILIRRGGACQQIENTDLYKVTYKKRNYVFKGDYNPAIPYMYGITLSNKYYWHEIFKNKNISIKQNKFSQREKLSFFITSDFWYNVILQRKTNVIGDGVSTLRQLIQKENLQRIKSQNKTLMPINAIMRENTLRRIISRGKTVSIPGNFEFTEITEKIHPYYLKLAQRIINTFPGLPYICFELFTDNISKKGNFYVGNILLSGGMNLFFEAIRGEKRQNSGEMIVNYMITKD